MKTFGTITHAALQRLWNDKKRAHAESQRRGNDAQPDAGFQGGVTLKGIEGLRDKKEGVLGNNTITDNVQAVPVSQREPLATVVGIGGDHREDSGGGTDGRRARSAIPARSER